MSIIELTEVKKSINNNLVLNNINLSLEEGKIYGFVGRNGCGKTMLFKAICGLINISEGTIFVDGKQIKNGMIPNEVGIIIENPGFLDNFSAFENLELLASIKNSISKEDIKKVIKLVGINPDDNKAIKKYSLGMKQRLGIAQAIMENPKILLLDEPMNGLDEEAVEEFRELFMKIKNNGTIILIASHNKDDIDKLCDHVYKMDGGKIIN